MAAAALALAPRLDIERANQHMRCMYMQAGSKMNSSDESSMNISKEYERTKLLRHPTSMPPCQIVKGQTPASTHNFGHENNALVPIFLFCDPTAEWHGEQNMEPMLVHEVMQHG